MKICYVTGHFPPHIGGVENLFLDIAEGMKERGHEVRVITSTSGGVHGQTVDRGVPVYHYDWKLLMGHPLCRKRDLAEHIKWADLVHTTTLTTANPTRVVCKKYKKLCICSIHEVLGDKWVWVEPSRFKALAFRQFEKYICSKPYEYIHVISDASKNDYYKHIGKRENIFRVYCSIDDNLGEQSAGAQTGIRDCFGLRDDDKTFLYFGRPAQIKGVFVYLDAIKLLLRQSGAEALKGYKFCFVLASNPPKQRERFLSDVKESGLSDLVLVSDPLPRADLIRVIKDSDYVVIPSVTEGFGFTTAEACALGKSVICSNAGSLPEVASGKVLFFENRDSGDLADKLQRVLTDGDSAFSEVPARTFSKERMVDELEGVYGEMVMNIDLR